MAKLKLLIRKSASEFGDAVQFIGLKKPSVGIITIAWLMLISVINVMLVDLKTEHLALFYIFAAILLAIISIATLSTSFLQRNQISDNAAIDLLHELRARKRYSVRLLASRKDLQAAHVVTQKIFEDRHPDFAWVDNLYGNFERPMTVLLVRKREPKKKPGQSTPSAYLRDKEIIGFASAWALTDEAGQKMSQGELDETQLRDDDLGMSNEDAKWIYLPAIANIEAISTASLSNARLSQSVLSSTILRIGLLDFLLENFFIDDRPRNLIVDAWSPEGRAEMNSLSKFLAAPISESVNESAPDEDIFTLRATASELRSAQCALLRRFAGVQPSLRHSASAA